MIGTLVIVALLIVVALALRSRGPAPEPPPTRPLGETSLALVRAELAAGRKLNAVKLYRQFTGASLKDSKEAVERMG